MRRCGAEFTLLIATLVGQNRNMPVSLRQNIVLIGFMGTGKSSIGRMLATRLGFQFVDTDRIIVERAGMEIPELFARDGESAFRDLETSALESLGHLTRCVIATGGGAILREENRSLLRELGFVTALIASEATILERVSRNARRPLLQTADPSETISRMLAERRPFYEEAAQFTLDTSALSHTQAAELIVAEARRVFMWQGAA